MSFLLNLLGGLSGQSYIYLVLVLGSFSSGFYIEHIRFVDFQDKVKIVAEQQIAENKAKLKEQELINRGVTDAYNANVSNIHNFYHRMLNDTGSGAMSSVPNATITINGTTINTLDFAEQCATTTQQLESTQDWIRTQIGLDSAKQL
jgi:hypothetical protein